MRVLKQINNKLFLATLNLSSLFQNSNNLSTGIPITSKQEPIPEIQ